MHHSKEGSSKGNHLRTYWVKETIAHRITSESYLTYHIHSLCNVSLHNCYQWRQICVFFNIKAKRLLHKCTIRTVMPSDQHEQSISFLSLWTIMRQKNMQDQYIKLFNLKQRVIMHSRKKVFHAINNESQQ